MAEDRGQDAELDGQGWLHGDAFRSRGGIRTRGKWADFQLHVEWATPTPARGEGQGRGNSGILINNLYEIQVLDSYHAMTYRRRPGGRDLRPVSAAGQCLPAARRMADLRHRI